MATPENCHDKLFKSTLSDPRDAAMELRAVLPPALGSQIDFSTLVPMPGSFIDERMRGSHADLLYKVRCAGKETLLYVLLEHKSEVDRWTLLQLLRYMVRIWEQYLARTPPPATLPPIIPVIVHHSETGWTAPRHFQGLFDATAMADADLRCLTPEFEVQLDDFSHCSDDELRARAMGPAATLGFLFLRDGRREGILDELPTWADLFRAVLRSPNGERAILQLFSYLSMVARRLGHNELLEQVARAIPERTDIVSTLAEQWLEEGERKGLEKGLKAGLEKGMKTGLEKGMKTGLEKGMKTGLEKGRKETLRRLIELKFGALDRTFVDRIESADEATLERYIERVLTATTAEEILSE